MSAKSSKVSKGKRGPLVDISNQNDTVEQNETSNLKNKRTRRSIGLNVESESSGDVKSNQQIQQSSSSSSESTSHFSKVTTTTPSSTPFNVPNSSRKSVNRTRTLPWKNQDPVHCFDILDDMYEHFFAQEPQYTPKAYMSQQTDINAKMRSILVDWLIEVHYKFRLQAHSLWTTMNVLDRYLEKVNVVRAQLQLVGVSALLIACKIDEVYPPEIADCVYITDNAYTKEQIIEMEITILKELDFHICVPTAYHFLSRYLNAIQASERTRHLAFYYAERNLQEIDIITLPPHKYAAASLYAALKQETCQYGAIMSQFSPWCVTLQEETSMREEDLIMDARMIIKHVSVEVETASRRRLISAKKKYSYEVYQYVSSLPLPQF